MNTAKSRIERIPLNNFRDFVVILDDLEFAFRPQQLEEIARLHNKGMWVTDIADEVKRNEYEVLLALVHLHKKRKLTRELAFRRKDKWV